MKTAEEILEATTCCTITEDACLDDPQNLYFQYDDVLRVMEQYAQEVAEAQREACASKFSGNNEKFVILNTPLVTDKQY